MAKRFSLREFGLLMAPILAVGAAGFWASRRSVNDGKPRVTFNIAKPTTLEAFEGNAGTFVVFFEAFPRPLEAEKSTLYLELQPFSNSRSSTSTKSSQILWKQSKAEFPDAESAFKARHIPPGNLYFGLDGSFKTWDAQSTQHLIHINKKWKVDRAQIKAPNLAALPRKPLISLVAIKISGVYSGVGLRTLVMGEAVFRFKSAAMDDKTPFEVKVSGSTGSMGWASNTQFVTTPKRPRHHITQWTIHAPKNPNQKTRISGRVSADNHWPLGFEIEPFDFKTAKVGQKLNPSRFLNHEWRTGSPNYIAAFCPGSAS